MTSHPRTNQLRSSHVDTDGAEPKNSQNPKPRIVVLTGAGISAESGISTFRDANGMWEQHRIEDVASPVAFANNPDMVHRFYDARRAQLNEVQPNAAHYALARLEAVFPDDVLIITQNVDDLHEAAGSENVLHMHGRLRSALCGACGARQDHYGDLGDRPASSACGEPALRPDVVWFGEQVREQERIRQAVDSCEIFAVIGTSGAVQPAAGFVHDALDHGAQTVLIDLDIDAHEDIYDLVYEGLASESVPHWAREVMLRHGAKDPENNDARDRSGELVAMIEDFVEGERFARSFDMGDGHTPERVAELLARLAITVSEHHPAVCELEFVVNKLLGGGSYSEAGNVPLVRHIMSHSAATAPIREELKRAQIEYAADLIAWMVADSVAPQELAVSRMVKPDPYSSSHHAETHSLQFNESTLMRRITDYLPFLASELDMAGRSDLAQRLRIHSDDTRYEVPSDLAQILKIGMELRLGMAFRVERNLRIVEHMLNNPSLEKTEDEFCKFEAVLRNHDQFLAAKQRGDVNDIRDAQKEFSTAMKALGEGFRWVDSLDLIAEVTKLNKAEELAALHGFEPGASR